MYVVQDNNHKSYTTNFTKGNIAADFENGKVKLLKLKEVKSKLHRDFSGQIKSATVSQVENIMYQYLWKQSIPLYQKK